MTTTAATSKETLDVYTLVTNRIIDQLEKNIVPWKKPWSESGPPANLLTKTLYTGINPLLLASEHYPTNLYLTFKQLKAIGGSVLKDEKGHVVVFYKRLDNKTENDEKKQHNYILRYYKVFNIAQCKGIPEHLIPSFEQHSFSPNSTCDEIVERMPKCPVIKHGKQAAYYNPSKDYINMPKQNSFASADDYYLTLFHELVHSTGHERRLNRKEITENANYGSEMYSQEELTAEIGACYLGSICGIGMTKFDNNLSYLSNWLAALKNDKRLVVYAAGKAQRAVDYILDVSNCE